MRQINIHEAKTQLSALVENAAKGESFIIAKSGKPMVTVSPYAPARAPKTRTGFLKGQLSIPEDFDQMGQQDIAFLFAGKE